MKNFSKASALAIGSEHVRLNLNNQDSLLITEDENYLMGVVSDGCGSCKHSEVGSNLMVRLVSKHISMCLRGTSSSNVKMAIDYACGNITSALRNISRELTDEPPSWPVIDKQTNTKQIQIVCGGSVWPQVNIVSQYLLATIVGFYICDEYTVVFSIGDGFYAINDEITCLETEDDVNNAPAYLAYNLIPSALGRMRPEAMNFSVKIFATSDIETIMVGTDGLRFMQESSDHNIPGKSRKVGPLSQLWEDKMFINSDMMRRTLSMLNKEVNIPDWVGQSMLPCASILKDDVAVISARRTK